MKEIAIIYDSFVGMTKKSIEKKGYYYIPLYLEINDESYLDGVDIDVIKAFDLIENAKNIKTSQPGINTIKTVFSKLSKKYPLVVYLSISSKLSSTFNTAYNLSKEYKNVLVVDNSLVGQSLLQMGEKIKKWYLSGQSNDEILKSINEYNKKCISFIIPKNMDTLQKSGRVSKASKFLLNTLKIIPIIEFNNSNGAKIKSVRRTQKKAFMKAFKMIIERIENNKEKYDDYVFEIVHTNNKKMYKYAIEYIKDKIGIKAMHNITSSIIAAHTGIGAFCITVYPK